jgi:hypothetical protein
MVGCATEFVVPIPFRAVQFIETQSSTNNVTNFVVALLALAVCLLLGFKIHRSVIIGLSQVRHPSNGIVCGIDEIEKVAFDPMPGRLVWSSFNIRFVTHTAQGSFPYAFSNLKSSNIGDSWVFSTLLGLEES